MLQINPFNENLYREIIELFLKKGYKTDAMNYYNNCVNTLRENFNISPEKATRNLLEKIKNSQSQSSKKILFLKIFCQESINQNFYYINELLKQIYNIVGNHLKKQVNINYLCEISKLSLVYENFLDEKELRTIDQKMKNIRLFDAIEACFSELSQSNKIKIEITNFKLIDQETEIIINRIRYIGNIEIEIN